MVVKESKDSRGPSRVFASELERRLMDKFRGERCVVVSESFIFAPGRRPTIGARSRATPDNTYRRRRPFHLLSFVVVFQISKLPWSLEV